MNVTEPQTRQETFAYGIVVLCESLPPGKALKKIEDQLWRSAFSGVENQAACMAQSHIAFRATCRVAFEEIDEPTTLRSMVDRRPSCQQTQANLFQQAKELSGLASSKIYFMRKTLRSNNKY